MRSPASDDRLGRVEGVEDVVRREPADNALREGDQHGLTFEDRPLPDAFARAAVFLGDDGTSMATSQSLRVM